MADKERAYLASLQPLFLQQSTILLLNLMFHAQLQSQKLSTDCR